MSSRLGKEVNSLKFCAAFSLSTSLQMGAPTAPALGKVFRNAGEMGFHTVQGIRKPRGSNNLADCDRKERLAILSGKFTFKLKMKVSFMEFQVRPRALEHSSGWISKLELFPTQLKNYGKVLLMCELDRHFLKGNPLASSTLESVFIEEIASSLQGAPAIKSQI
ncbi:hypothetical protein TNIN_436831 [Trichonephila inaurata madagascariensis]|uniref:Uncharacterized protein n=1 Tax=Trichonephila inaurata madagascariensis TaxID=2747483 RepID=A0A8X6X924_9ARAC|nr:hypothetical protein TNIN_436831 [Trichonephila inaurata madagascariensis]